MAGLKRSLAALLIAALPVWAGPSHAQGTQLTAGEMRITAADMLDRGRAEVALELTDALLERDPGDVQALLIRSRALRDLGDFDGAKAAARAVLQRAEEDQALRYAASLAMAQALSSEGRRTAAQLWLRRAAHNAPNDFARARAEADFRYVRSRNRWSTQLRFSVTPNSNVNNGSVHDSAQLYGLPFELALPGATQALSGLELTFGATTRYRLAETRTQASDLILSGWRRTYILSDSAKQKAPGAEGSDFATTTLSAGFGHKRLLNRGRNEVSFELLGGRHWRGGDHYGDFVRAQTGLRHKLTRRDSLEVGVQADRTVGPRAPHATALELSGGWTRQLAEGGRFGLSLAVADSRSQVDVADYTQVEVGLDYVHGEPVMGAEARMGVSWRWRDFDRSSFAPGQGRTDRELSAYLDLTFTQIDYYGFHPTLTLKGSRQDSSVDLFDIDRIGAQIGIRSAF